MLRGWTVDALNPKGTVFLLAVVPQFLDLAQPLAPQYVLIAATLGFTDLVVMAGYTALAARVLRLLKSPRQIRLMNRTFGGLFIGAGALLAGTLLGSTLAGAAAGGPGSGLASAELTGTAELPALTFGRRARSGTLISAANGVVPPFARQPVQVDERQRAYSVRPRQVHHRVERREGDAHVRRVRGDARQRGA